MPKLVDSEEKIILRLYIKPFIRTGVVNLDGIMLIASAGIYRRIVCDGKSFDQTRRDIYRSRHRYKQVGRVAAMTGFGFENIACFFIIRDFVYYKFRSAGLGFAS